MIISFSREFIFLKTQKTGGSSVEIALSTLCGDNDVLTNLTPEEEAVRLAAGRSVQNVVVPGQFQPWWAKVIGPRTGRLARGNTKYVSHMDAKSVRARMNPSTFDRFRKISIIRNPWDREVSLYFWHTRNSNNPPTFSHFVKRWCRNPERKTFKIYSIDGRVIASDIWRYESLTEDYTRFVLSLGIKDVPPLLHAKGAIRPKRAKDYQSMYDSETRDIVARRYANEIALFGYSFE